VTGLEVDDLDHPDPAQGLEDWLKVQRVGRVTVDEPTLLVDVHDPDLLNAVAKHPLVHAALAASGLGTGRTPAQLDEAVIRLPGPVGRPITQVGMTT
jgi:hypothetical protein